MCDRPRVRADPSRPGPQRGEDWPADLGPPPHRLRVTTSQLARLVADQFPHWSDLPIRPVAAGGWDNWTFHLGPDMSARLPSATEYALAVEKEHHWLPRLAPHLPFAIPKPLGLGQPGSSYPFAWSIYDWLSGHPVPADGVNDPIRFASDLAEFLAALQRIDPTGGPAPGKHNWFRGGTLRTFDGVVQRALAKLEGEGGIDARSVRHVWVSALEARWQGRPRWFHGDVAASNLLLEEGRLAAVIDFGTCGVGDPSCDLAAAWTLLTPEGRRIVRTVLDVDDLTWARGRGWALWKTVSECAATADQPQSIAGTRARRVLQQILRAPQDRQ